MIETKGEYKTACNVLLSLEQIVRSSDGWEDSAVEAVHNAVQTAIKYMHERPQGEWTIIDDTVCECPLCKHQQTFLLSPKESNVNFCEKCGADMRGDKEWHD